MRIYLPATLPMLRQGVETGSFRPVGGLGFAVIRGLAAEYPGADTEDLEYLAMHDAALASLRLIAAGGADPVRVVPPIDAALGSGRGLFVLCRTSNPEGASVQLAVAPEGPARSAADPAPPMTISAQIACAAADLNTGVSPMGSIGLVVGATVTDAERREHRHNRYCQQYR